MRLSRVRYSASSAVALITVVVSVVAHGIAARRLELNRSEPHVFERVVRVVRTTPPECSMPVLRPAVPEPRMPHVLPPGADSIAHAALMLPSPPCQPPRTLGRF
jgi:hypothetical protein